MKKFWFWVLVAISLYGIWKLSTMPQDAFSGEPAQAALADAPFATQTPRPTRTPKPEPTVGYLATIEALGASEGTAKAELLNYQLRLVDATQTREAGQLELARITQQANADRMAELAATQTALPTVIPMTRTAMMMAATNQALSVTQAVMIQQEPTRIVEMARARAIADTARTRELMTVYVLAAIASFILAGAIGLLRFLWRQTDAPAPEAAEQSLYDEGTVITYRQETSGGYVDSETFTFPCTPQQLLELAEGIQADRSLAINNWEGAGTLWKRETIIEVRQFMVRHGLAFETQTHAVYPTERGRAIFEGYLASGDLPHPFQFAPDVASPSGNSAHAHENHAHEMVGEGSV